MKRRSFAVCGEERYISSAIKRSKVQAQRKFAQGSINYTYSTTKIVSKTQENVFQSFQSSQQISDLDNEERELNNFSRLPSVDDFLTFLCFRDTDVLPERLNYLSTPEFDALTIKKKRSRYNVTNPSVKNPNNDPGQKFQNELKNKKQGKYKLRSRNIAVPGKGIVTDTSCSLALKHNQRLRSKSVAQAQICESKLQNFKTKSTLSKKLKSHSSTLAKPKVKSDNFTPKPIVKRQITNELGKHESNFQRVTRRNSLLEKLSGRTSSFTKPVVTKKSVSKQSTTSLKIRKISVCLHDSQIKNSKKPTGRSLRISLSKVKNAGTKSLISTRASLKPTIRSTRSCTVQKDTSFQKVNSRPSRRTKEAAVLYMEMLGKELLCPEENFDDDDNISVESFPELPNTEQHMRREKELKEISQKKNLEKPIPRRTSHTKSELFVRRCKNCTPVKIATKSPKATREEHIKTVKEKVEVTKRIKISKKEPKDLKLRKNTYNSLKTAKSERSTNELSSKVIDHLQTSKQLLTITEPIGIITGCSKIIEKRKSTENESKSDQTVASSNTEVFNLESKKIFKKCASSFTSEEEKEVNPKKSDAFSADNETSIHAFEPGFPGNSPPFKREKSVTHPKPVANNSIAVQVNFENDSECSDSAEAQVSSTSDYVSGDRVFYIPIQTSISNSTLGVAVKLDKDEASQKIIMSATLITNSSSCTSDTTTTVCSKTSNVETMCTLTKMITSYNKEQMTKKVYSTSSAESGKMINSSDDKDEQDVCSSTVSISKSMKNLPIKESTQCIRILKINKKKTMKKNSKKPERLVYSVLKKKTQSVSSESKKVKLHKSNSKALSSAKKMKSLSVYAAGKHVTKVKSQLIDSEVAKKDVTDTKMRIVNPGSLELEAKKVISPSTKNKNVKSTVQESQAYTEKLSTPKGEIREAPTFYPNEEEFNDPLEYINKIRSEAEKFGMCRIVPPSNFRPECKVSDEMRFTAYNQYVHKMLDRWGPNVKEMMAIKKFLATQNITFTHPPWIGGMEVDLPHLYQIVQQCGGLKAVIEKERWQMVADIMRIPKLAQDRITKLDDIYCKYLLPYDILSHDEREKLFEEIEKEWMDHLKNPSDDEVFEDIDECIVKGRTMPLSCFYRIARNTMMMYFGNMEDKERPLTETIEKEFWNHVSKRKSHICVHCGSIDSGTYGYGFSVAKNSTFRKHPWNLKVLTNNSASILRFLGPVLGVTVPTLHVGMLYSACCWYRDPHGLPWIEYLHTGANKIWYGISDDHSEQFREAMLLLVPRYCKDKKIWLPSDTVMIPPSLLTSHNIPLSRVVQQPGQFIVVFPKAFTSSISTGYLVSESVYFAHASWLNTGKQVFMDMQDSCEPTVFSFEQLLINIAEDTRSSLPILMKVLPLLLDLRETERTIRSQLKKKGLYTFEKLNVNRKRKIKGTSYEESSYECDTCHTILFISLVVNSKKQRHYCLKHAVSLLNKKPTQMKYCTLMYAYTEEELDGLINKVKVRIEAKNNKKSHSK